MHLISDYVRRAAVRKGAGWASWGALALVAACTPAPAAAPATLYEPDTRPPVWINFSPRTRTPENPYGFQRDWHDPQSAEQWLRSQLARGDRVIVRTPFGDDVEGWVTSSQWHVAEPWRRAMFIRVVNEWLAADPTRTFSLYIGTLVGDTNSRAMEDARSPSPDDQAALDAFLAEIRPWLAATKIHRVWLDHSSAPPENRANVVKLAAWCREHLDLQIGMEAWPRADEGTKGGPLDLETMRRLPTLATWRYPESFDKERDWRAPEGFEALLIVIPQPRSPTPTSEALLDYRRRGFIIGSGHQDYDSMVREVNAAPAG